MATATTQAKAETAPVAAVAAPVADAGAAAPAPAADVAPAVADAAAAPAADAKASETKAPSLLGAADAAKHADAAADGAAKPTGDGKAADTKSTDAKTTDSTAAAKPADGEKPAADAAEAADTKPAEGDKPKDDAAKADDAAKPKDDKKPADALADKPPVPPKYDALKLPEAVKLDDSRVAAFDTIIGDTELATKADHGQMTALRQKLVDFHVDEIKRVGEQVLEHQRTVWNRYNEGLIAQFKADPELGGNRELTTLGNAKYAFENHLGLNQEQRDGLLEAMNASGMGNHPLMIRALNNLYERLREGGPVNPNLPSIPARGKEAGQRGWYDNLEGGAKAG